MGFILCDLFGLCVVLVMVSHANGCSESKTVRLMASNVARYLSSQGMESCNWLLVARETDQIVKLQIEDISYHYNNCSLNHISIYDGSTLQMRRLGMSCIGLQSDYESSGRYMLISLQPNRTSSDFVIKYYMFSKSKTNNFVSIIGGIIGALIILLLLTTVVCTVKNHHSLPTILPMKLDHNSSRRKKSTSNQTTTTRIPRISVIQPPMASSISDIYVQPISYPSALQPSTSKVNQAPNHPFDESDMLKTTYNENNHFTNTRSVISPGGYLATDSSSFDNFE